MGVVDHSAPRDWVDNAVRLIDADSQRSADTHVSQPAQVVRSTQVRRSDERRPERVERRESRREGVRIRQQSRRDDRRDD